MRLRLIRALSRRSYQTTQRSYTFHLLRTLYPVIPVNPYAISLFWSQDRPLTLFHDLHHHHEFTMDSPRISVNKKIHSLSTSPITPFTLYPFQRLDHFIPLQPFNPSTFFSPSAPSTRSTRSFSPSSIRKKYATSVKRKRRLKMNKHKFEKRRDKQRALRKRIGK
ncbi:hypothetical protein PCK1_001639 [Pneumocystis canis]|nr:hypothetical protein PCK1_001639 [Pneumocystis canis]